jgi:hypothetical protein
MPDQTRLRLSLLDVSGKLLRQPCTVRLRHQVSGVQTVVSVSAQRHATIAKLLPGVYSVQVDPASYRALGRFVDVRTSALTAVELRFPVDPAKVKSAIFPRFDKVDPDARRVLTTTKALLGYEGVEGASLYQKLEDDRVKKAGFMNILAKAAAVVLSNKRTVSSYIHEVLELRGDRFFAVVPKELREETKNSVHDDIFREAPDALHHPPSGFERAGSFKTNDHYGNLQLTFFTNGADWRADVDIDDAGGLAHVFQVLRNELTGKPTHPFDIREILIHHQHLNPGYTLDV